MMWGETQKAIEKDWTSSEDQLKVPVPKMVLSGGNH